jgi:hypothetical protein
VGSRSPINDADSCCPGGVSDERIATAVERVS